MERIGVAVAMCSNRKNEGLSLENIVSLEHLLYAGFHQDCNIIFS
jgi:hypothetical protein